jgi:hypothetical protein
MRRWKLGFGVLGAALAWTVLMLVTSIAGEAGCVGGPPRSAFLGVSPVAWGLGLFSGVCLAVGVSALRVARCEEAKRASGGAEAAATAAERYLAGLGAVTSLAFLLFLFVQGLPVLFFLRC